MSRPPLDADPTPAALSWVAGVMAKEVVAWRAFAGATTAAIHDLTLRDGRHVVLKHFIWQDFVEEDPARAEREAWALEKVSGRVPAPRLLGCDPTGSATGAPAVLTSLVAGSHDLGLDPHALATGAAAIAGVESEDTPWAYRPYFAGNELFVPPWTGEPEAWRVLIDTAPAVDTSPSGFIHRDYHPWNVLAVDGAITGIVDWLSAGPGPWQIDVSHCRLNLMLLGRPDAAGAYTAGYERLTQRHFSPEWDALTIVDALPYYGSPDQVDEWSGYSVLATTAAEQRQQRRRIDAYAIQTAQALG